MFLIFKVFETLYNTIMQVCKYAIIIYNKIRNSIDNSGGIYNFSLVKCKATQ
jgi:hypothetical protein